MEDLSGKTIRGFELKERIGEGGFGVVYRAHQSAIERDVVIKAILPVYANNPDFIRNFEAEAQLIARLEHPHIVPLYDYWRGPDGAFLVMRWLRGGSLLDSLDSGPWHITDTARLLEQIAGALTIAHRGNVVHQDIKPANILLDDDRNAYLTDFGLAKDLETRIDLSVASDSNVHGSPAYVSPEQVKRTEISTRTDIYSLGIVLYELLCGVHPFRTNDVVELLRHHLNTQLPSLQDKYPELPDSLSLVLWRATAKDPSVRYETVIEMAAAFRHAIAGMDDTTTQSAGHVSARPEAMQSDTGLISAEALEALLATPSNPYKGLLAFQEADAGDFYGRAALIETLLRRLQETDDGHRFLAIVGPSGSGKSSVVKAGLLPAIRRGKITNWNHWYILEMTPGTEPLTEVVNSLLSIATDTDISHLIEDHTNTNGLHQAIQTILPDEKSEIILVIDQFEEVFTLVDDEAVRTRFLQLITDAVSASESRLRVIITLRADFYDRPLLYPEFGQLIRARSELVLPLTEEELRDVITAPAESANLAIEDLLTEVILADVARQPNALPLLQFTLTELYEQRKGDRLTLEAYRRIGGIAGALAQRADEIYAASTPAQRQAIRQIFLRLVMPGEGAEDTRRRVIQTELQSLANDRQIIEHVLDTFGRYRLLTFDHDPETRLPTVEVAHEALIRSWDKIRDWLNETRHNLRTHRQLTLATEEWQRANYDPSFLASGARLEQFETIGQMNRIALNQTETDYLNASLARNTRNNRLRRAVQIVLAITSIVMMALAIIALDQSNRTEIARQRAVDSQATAIGERQRADQETLISRSRELAASALVSQNQIDLPLLLSIEALANADTLEARNSLLSTLQAAPRLMTFLNGHHDTIRSVAYGQRYIATASRDQTVRLWDADTLAPLEPSLSGHESWVNAVAFGPDDNLLASGDMDGTILVWEIADQPVEFLRLTNHTDAIWSLAFSPDGNLLVSGSADNTIRIWDIETGQEMETPLDTHQGIIYSLAFSPDGTQLASGSADSTIQLWNTETWQRQYSLQGHTNWVFSTAFSPDGTLLVSGSADNTIRLWDLQTGNAIGNILRGHADWVRSVLFDHNGQHIISGSADGFILMWDLATGQPIDLIETPGRDAVWSISLNNAGNRLVSGGINPAPLIWNIDNQPTLGQFIGEHAEEILTVTASHEGDYLATAGGQDNDYDISIWDADDMRLLGTLAGHTAPRDGGSVSPCNAPTRDRQYRSHPHDLERGDK